MASFLPKMAQRGRKSEAGIEAEAIVDVRRRPRLGPPAELTDAQAAIWRDAVASMPGNWLTRGAQPILTAYCRHVCRARTLENLISTFSVDEIKKADDATPLVSLLDKLLAAAERETRAATACARALRLTPQAMIAPRSAGRRVADLPENERRPWEMD
jgi:hypothetical protein